jgi:PAS domain S-box-containing protein
MAVRVDTVATALLQPDPANEDELKLDRHFFDLPADELLETLPAAVYATDAAGRITFYNQAAVELWGQHPELGVSEWCGSWRLYWPDGRPMPHGECPMAVALREERAIRGAEAVAERPDGSRVPFLAYPTPLRDPSGMLVGAVNTLVDISERKRAEKAGERLASIVEYSDDAIVSKDLDGIIVTWNRGAERLFGYTAAEVVGKPITMLIPEDRAGEEPSILERLRRGERIEHFETVRRRKDGSLVEISLTVSPVRDSGGKVVGASKIARDITELRRAQQQQRLLLREINHRVKNLLTLANGVVALSARHADSVADLATSVQHRLGALARAHELTLPDLADAEAKGDRATTLHALVRAVVSPYVDAENGDDRRIAVGGPEVAVGGGVVAGMALLLHELATNAAKYGALSSAEGRVDIEWSVENDTLRLTWREHDGPPLDVQPTSEGFGSVLVRATVKGQLGGEIAREWLPDGLVVRLTAPLARVTR